MVTENLQLPSFLSALSTRCLLTENSKAELIYCLYTMYHIFTITAYTLGELICFLIFINIGINRYYNGLRLHNIFEYSLSTKQFAVEFLAFVLAEVLVGFLIGLCERRKFEPEQTSVQPVIGLLISTFLIALVSEVCDLLS
jgi:hypothetical protein